MDFEQVKELIEYMNKHPYVILNSMRVFTQGFMPLIQRMIHDIESKIEDENANIFYIEESDQKVLMQALMYLPAIMLIQDDEKAWEIYDAIILLVQNYGEIFGLDVFNNVLNTISKLSQAKTSFETLIVQSESLVLQQQAMINSSNTPYRLSHRFLTSILEGENNE